MVNRDALLAEVRHITVFPEEHNQGIWAQKIGPRPSACGTFACLAGNTVIRAGLRPDWYVADYVFEKLPNGLTNQEENEEFESAWDQVFRANRDNKALPLDGFDVYITGRDVKVEDLVLPENIAPVWEADSLVQEDGGEWISDKAREIMGLTRDQGAELFEGDNTLDYIWYLAIEFTKDDENPITEADRQEAQAEYLARTTKEGAK